MKESEEHVKDIQSEILPLRKQRQLRSRWTKKRLQQVLAKMMRLEGIDMWVVISREDNEDPVAPTLVPPVLSADMNLVLPPTGDTLILALKPGGEDELECMALSAVDFPSPYENVWRRDREDLWQCLRRVVRQNRPDRIGINVSQLCAYADGLTYSLRQQLLGALDGFPVRLVSAEGLAVRWLHHKLPAEMDAYRDAVGIAHRIIEQAFSSEVVSAQTTTLDDLSWWMRERIHKLGLRSWFQPQVHAHRRGEGCLREGIIRRGDMLFCDLGLEYLGLLTDTQQLAYVLRPDEQRAPLGLRQAMQDCNRLQDIVTSEFAAGAAGNEVLSLSLARARDEGIDAFISTHPIGYYGHGPGPSIGVWDQQDGVDGKGDYPIRNDTCYALELCVVRRIPEWDGQKVRINLEETVTFRQDRVEYPARRQREFHLIG